MSTDFTSDDGGQLELSSGTERHISSPGTEVTLEQPDHGNISPTRKEAVHEAIRSSASAALRVSPTGDAHANLNDTMTTQTASTVSPTARPREGHHTADEVHGESTTIWSSSNNATGTTHGDVPIIENPVLQPLNADESDADIQLDTPREAQSERLDDGKIREELTDSETIRSTSTYADLSEPVRAILSEVKQMAKAEHAQAAHERSRAGGRPKSNLADPLGSPSGNAYQRKVRSSHGSPTALDYASGRAVYQPLFTSMQPAVVGSHRNTPVLDQVESDRLSSASDARTPPPPPIAADTEEDDRELATIFRDDEQALSSARTGNDELEFEPLSALRTDESETDRLNAATRRRLADLLAQHGGLRRDHGDTDTDTKPKSKRGGETVSDGDGDEDEDGTEISIASYLSEDSVAQRVRRVLAETAHLDPRRAAACSQPSSQFMQHDLLTRLDREVRSIGDDELPKSARLDDLVKQRKNDRYTTLYYEGMLRDLEEIHSRINRDSARRSGRGSGTSRSVLTETARSTFESGTNVTTDRSALQGSLFTDRSDVQASALPQPAATGGDQRSFLKWDHAGDVAVHRVVTGSREHESFICSPDDTDELDAARERERERERERLQMEQEQPSPRPAHSLEALRILQEADRAELRLRELQARRRLKADLGLSDIQQRAALAAAAHRSGRRREPDENEVERADFGPTRTTETQTDRAAKVAASDYLAELLRAQLDRPRADRPIPSAHQFASASSLFDSTRGEMDNNTKTSTTAVALREPADEKAAWRTETASAGATPMKPTRAADPERSRIAVRTFDTERTRSQPSLSRQPIAAAEYDYMRELQTSGLLRGDTDREQMQAAAANSSEPPLRIPLQPASQTSSVINTDNQNVRFDHGARSEAVPPSQVQQSVPSTARSATTLDSTHPGSDDAQAPTFPPSVLGSRPDPQVVTAGVYGTRSPPARRVSPVRELTEREITASPASKVDAEAQARTDQLERPAPTVTAEFADRNSPKPPPAQPRHRPGRAVKNDDARAKPAASANAADLQSIWDRFDTLYRERGTLTTDRLREFEALLRDPLQAVHAPSRSRAAQPIVVDTQQHAAPAELPTARTVSSVSTVDTGELVSRLTNAYDDEQLVSVRERAAVDQELRNAASPSRKRQPNKGRRPETSDEDVALDRKEFDAKAERLAAIITKYEKKAANDRRRQLRHSEMAMRLSQLLTDRDKLASLDPTELSDMDTASTATFVVDDDVTNVSEQEPQPATATRLSKPVQKSRARAAGTQTGLEAAGDESDDTLIDEMDDRDMETDNSSKLREHGKYRAPLSATELNAPAGPKIDRGINTAENVPLTVHDAAKAGYRIIRARARTSGSDKQAADSEAESHKRFTDREKLSGSERGSDVHVDRLSLKSDVLQRWKNDAEKLGRSRLRLELAPAPAPPTRVTSSDKVQSTRSATSKHSQPSRRSAKENDDPAGTGKASEPTDRSRYSSFPTSLGSEANLQTATSHRSANSATPRDDFIGTQRDAAASARPSGISWYVALPSERQQTQSRGTLPRNGSPKKKQKAADSQSTERDATEYPATENDPSSSRRVTAFATQPDVQLYFSPRDSYRFGAPLLGDENVPTRERTLSEAFERWRGSRPFLFRSGARQRRIKLAVDERDYEKRLQVERDRLFDLAGGRRARQATVIDPLADNLYLPKKRYFTFREMRDHTERVYRTLPEVRNRILSECREAQYRTNRLKAQLFKQKILRDVLDKKTKWASVSAY